MKQISLLLLAAAIACGGKKKEVEQPVVEAPSVEEKKPEPPPPPPPPSPVWTLKDVGFETPESVLYDAESDVYLVSNISGAPSAKDKNGFISKVKADGTLETLKWIDGSKKATPLHAPKGMVIVGGVLYVTDIDVVRAYDLKTGKAKTAIPVKGATFLNDIAAGPSGTLYVTDTGVKIDETGITPTGTDAVWKIVKGKASVVAKGEELGKPNGILVDRVPNEDGTEADGPVWVVTFGSGQMYRLGDDNKPAGDITPAGQLDGLVGANGTLWISSWEKSAVLAGNNADGFEVKFADLKAPADLGFDTKRNLVLIPLFTENQVLAFEAKEALWRRAAAAALPAVDQRRAQGESAGHRDA
jgi:sugar lactone lactonase YvrE